MSTREETSGVPKALAATSDMHDPYRRREVHIRRHRGKSYDDEAKANSHSAPSRRTETSFGSDRTEMSQETCTSQGRRQRRRH